MIVLGLYIVPHLFYAIAFPLLHPEQSDGILLSAFMRPYIWAYCFSPLRFMSPLVLPIVLALAAVAGCICSGYRWGRITAVANVILMYAIVAYNTLFFILFSFGNGFISA